MTIRTRLEHIAILLLFCILTACNNSSKPRAQSHIIHIRNMQFVPAELSVNAGDTVIWKNEDMVAHDVTEESSRAWSSSKLEPGSQWKKIIGSNTSYFCSIHMVMKGKIITN